MTSLFFRRGSEEEHVNSFDGKMILFSPREVHPQSPNQIKTSSVSHNHEEKFARENIASSLNIGKKTKRALKRGSFFLFENFREAAFGGFFIGRSQGVTG
jgi:hypothetical protein